MVQEGGSLWCPTAPSLTLMCQGRRSPAPSARPSSALLTPSHLIVAEKCHKPQWDPRFIFEQDQVFYDVNEEVMMKCPEGYWSSTTEIKCVKLNPRQGSATSRSIWFVKNVTGRWHPVEGNMTCVGERTSHSPSALSLCSASRGGSAACVLQRSALCLGWSRHCVSFHSRETYC